MVITRFGAGIGVHQLPGKMREKRTSRLRRDVPRAPELVEPPLTQRFHQRIHDDIIEPRGNEAVPDRHIVVAKGKDLCNSVEDLRPLDQAFPGSAFQNSVQSVRSIGGPAGSGNDVLLLLLSGYPREPHDGSRSSSFRRVR